MLCLVFAAGFVGGFFFFPARSLVFEYNSSNSSKFQGVGREEKKNNRSKLFERNGYLSV